MVSSNIEGHGGDLVILTYLTCFCAAVNFCRVHGFTGFCGIRCCKKVSEKINYPAVFDKINQELENNDQTFYESLRSRDKKWLIAEEKFLQERYQIKRIPPENLQMLEQSPRRRRTIITTPFYDILANQSYRNKFEYISRNMSPPKDMAMQSLNENKDNDYKDPTSEIDFYELSSQVTLLINLAYMPYHEDQRKWYEKVIGY